MPSVEECYKKMGGNYERAAGLLRMDAMIKKFAAKFLDDPSYNQLCESMATGDVDTAFRAAHTLKGVCANLGFEKLQNSASELCETLRGKDAIGEDTQALLPGVMADYELTVEAIKEME
ncbi:MAG: Hpt domain-containing protein [Coriobacteriia bacterium]|nr:Hpt domain-containing protein [Coriobacteriia bacterium]